MMTAAMAALLPAAAGAATASRERAGTLADGTQVDAVTLANGHGMKARILAFGATLQSVIVPDRQGRPADVALGYDDLASYVANPNYWGATVGRYANRIAGGRFALDGKTYQLPLNDKTNSLHGGGATGYDRRPWRIVSVKSGPAASVTLALDSPDGDAGYPGALKITATYALDENNALTETLDATTTRPTVVNLTNHAIWNLAGEGAPGGALDERLFVPAAAYTPVNEALIPTGERRAVAGTPFDFRTPRALADRVREGRDEQIRFGHGYDHNFALDKGATSTPQLAARLEDPASGRVMELLTTEPGVQLYTANFLDAAIIGKSGHLYRQGDGVALEPQKFPDAPNQPGFVSARVDPGHPYHHVMTFRFSTLP
jgi:aldose 1-epimerase